MRQIFYAMQFQGKAEPLGNSPNTLKANTTAPSASLTSVAGIDGLSGSLQPASGDEAVFESEVILTDETSFEESGTISFGKGGHLLHFSTVGQGYLGPSPDPKAKHGSVIWRVDGGKGQFERASGLITSNFTITDTGEVIDNHFGVVYVE